MKNKISSMNIMYKTKCMCKDEITLANNPTTFFNTYYSNLTIWYENSVFLPHYHSPVYSFYANLETAY